MYSLKESGITAFQQLVNCFHCGYEPMKYTPGFGHQKTRKNTLYLCVYDFGVKHFYKYNNHHPINSVKNHYSVTIDLEGKLYYSLKLKFKYDEGYVDVSMENYILYALQKIYYNPHKNPQHAPHLWNDPIYGHKIAQKPIPTSSEAPIETNGKHHVQYIACNFL